MRLAQWVSLIFALSSARAQKDAATIVETVKDESGAVVAGARFVRIGNCRYTAGARWESRFA